MCVTSKCYHLSELYDNATVLRNDEDNQVRFKFHAMISQTGEILFDQIRPSVMWCGVKSDIMSNLMLD